MINSLSTAIGGMSTVVTQSVDSRSTRELGLLSLSTGPLGVVDSFTGSDSFLIGF